MNSRQSTGDAEMYNGNGRVKGAALLHQQDMQEVVKVEKGIVYGGHR